VTGVRCGTSLKGRVGQNVSLLGEFLSMWAAQTSAVVVVDLDLQKIWARVSRVFITFCLFVFDVGRLKGFFFSLVVC
jgi:hypothetical protein